MFDFPTGTLSDFTLTTMLLRYRIFLAASSGRSRLLQSRTYSSVRDEGQEARRAARAWLATLHADALSSIGEISFSRSSGPGGQNVNKYDKLANSNGALC